jgi:adenylate kinase family enzyme
MPKIAIVGTSCSGKTTLARRLAAHLDVPHVELDALHHGPGWTEAPRDEFRALVTEAVSGPDWVVDGNYHGKLGDLVLKRVDIVVWLDLPILTILPRLWGRTLHRIRTRAELWNGNRETWRDAFLSRQSLFIWVLRTHLGRRRRYETSLARFESVRLRSAEEVELWLQRYLARPRAS